MPRMAHQFRHQLSSIRIRTRLLGLVLLPLLGVTMFATSAAASRSRVASQAQAVSANSVRAGALSQLVAAINTELDATRGMAQSLSFGIDPVVVAEASGIDLEASLGRSRARVDDSYAAMRLDHEWLDPPLVASIIEGYSQIERLRERLDDGVVTVADTEAIRDTLEEDSTTATRAELRALAFRQAGLPDGQLLARSVESATNTLELVGAARGELARLSNYLLPLPTEEDEDPWEALIVSAALYDRAGLELERSLPAELAVAWQQAKAAPPFVAYDKVRSDTLAGTQLGWDENAEFSSVFQVGATTFQTGLERLDVMTGFDEQISEFMVAESRRLELRAQAGFRQAFLSAVSLVVGTLAAAAITARSIARPLDQLERRARKISAGEFEESVQNEPSGPHDVIAVGRVLDELAANLVTIDSQAAALAEGDLNAEILDEVPAGTLGASIQHSVVRVRNMTATLDYQAHHDSLTGLANRAAVIDALAESTQSSSGEFVTLSMFDLDGFKHANDTLGHLVGDELLRHAGNRLAADSGGHLVARLGGDEFVILTTSHPDDTEVVAVAAKALRSLREPFQTSAGMVWLTASVGVATMSPSEGMSSLELLRRADLALYEAKAAGPGSLARYDDRLSALVDEQSRIEVGLRKAIDNDLLTLHYQPIIELASRRTAGYETLVRWQQPDGSMIPPDLFVPIAERTDLIIHLDQWVINRACQKLAALNSHGEGVGLSVNISGRHLGTSRIVGVVEDALNFHGARPQDLLVEMTETGLIPNFEHAVDSLSGLRQLGVRVAIDDFGTGFASVAHLRKSHFDRLKIDRAFIANLDQPQERSIAQLLISLGRDLGLEVVAEGLETEEQVTWAHRMGCTHGQGYFLGRPAPTIPTEVENNSRVRAITG